MIPRLHLPMLQPGDVVPHLGKGQLHWREGFSAHALATTWFRSNALPAPVRTLLDTHPHFAGAELVDAVLERQTSLEDGIRGHSQTDLLAIIGLGPALAVAAVEGKVEESFGPLIADWATTPIAQSASPLSPPCSAPIHGTWPPSVTSCSTAPPLPCSRPGATALQLR